MIDDRMVDNVIRRAFKYDPKETKEHRAEKLAQTIREKTGLSKGVAGAIADALVRGRDVIRLALQKGWPVDEEGRITGPSGELALSGIARAASGT